MAKLVVIRHAKSDWQYSGLVDLLRPLNERGYKAVSTMAERSILMENIPDRICCSPAVRAYTTAVGLISYLGLSLASLEICPWIYENSVKQMRRALAPYLQSNSVVWLVGHNPSLELLLGELLPEQDLSLATLGCVVLEQEDTEGWRLLQRDSPKQSDE